MPATRRASFAGAAYGSAPVNREGGGDLGNLHAADGVAFTTISDANSIPVVRGQIE